MAFFLQKPKDIRVSAIIFFGRRNTVEILDHYLRRNLVRCGGWLDDVHFLLHTRNEDDLAWIKEKVAKVPEYHTKDFSHDAPFGELWRRGVTPGSITIKLDDDIVWLGDDTIPHIVSTLLARPEAFCVLSNLINSAAFGWIHHRNGAIHPYLPEAKPTDVASTPQSPETWRASELPTYELQPQQQSPQSKPLFDDEEDLEAPVPSPNHRWLPLRSEIHLPITSITRAEYSPWSFNWWHWQVAAQEHYSFLHNLESNDLSAYEFGNQDGVWNMRYMRSNINVMAIRADDILAHTDEDFEKKGDDEQILSVDVPKRLGRQVYVQTKALAAHFAFKTQGALYETDLLGRYRAYANEMICSEGERIPVTE